MTAPFWFLAWVGFSIVFGLFVAEVWIRVRDNARSEGIDLDTEDARRTQAAVAGARCPDCLVEVYPGSRHFAGCPTWDQP